MDEIDLDERTEQIRVEMQRILDHLPARRVVRAVAPPTPAGVALISVLLRLSDECLEEEVAVEVGAWRMLAEPPWATARRLLRKIGNLLARDPPVIAE